MTTANTSRRARLANHLGPPPDLPVTLVAQSIVWSIGEGMFLVGSALFLTRWAGLSPTQVGIGLSVAAGARFLARIPSAMVADRMGGRRAWFVASVAQAVLYGCYPLVHGLVPFMLTAASIATSAALGSSGRGKYLGDILSAGQRVQAQAFLRSIVNIGFTVAALAAAGVSTAESSGPYVVFALVASSTFVVECFLLSAMAKPGESGPAPSRLTPASVRDWPIVLLSLVNGVIASGDTVLLVVVPLWVVTNTDASPSIIGVLLVANTAMTILFQVAASRNAETVTGAALVQRRAAIAVMLACLCLAPSGLSSGAITLLLLTLAVVTLTVGELFGEAGLWGLSYGLSPSSHRAEYLAIFTLGNDVMRIVSPALFTFITINHSNAGWYYLVPLFLAAGLSVVPVSSWAQRTARSTDERPACDNPNDG